MRCPECNGVTRVMETKADTFGMRRKRECNVCGYRFFTLERFLRACGKSRGGRKHD